MSVSLCGSPARKVPASAQTRIFSTARPAPIRCRTAAAAAAAAASMAATSPAALPAAYVYCGPGAGTRSVLSTLHSLREALVPTVKVVSLGTAELLAGGWQPGCLLLVMPGGADLPYCKHLNGRGNQLIREYVEGGGSYLGLCAGAYYACARVEFEPGTRLEVVGERELAFFPGAAVGSIYRGFQYESEAGAVAAPLRFRCQQGEAGAAGAQAGAAPNPGSSGQSTGGGGSSGSNLWQWEQCTDYVNGGPGFRLLDGSPLPPRLLGHAAQGQQGAGQQAAQPDKLLQQAAQQQEQPEMQHSLESVEVLATYPEHDDAAAALLCRVGSQGGRAVLCSSHPELHPSWLGGAAPPQNASDGARNGGSSSSSSVTNGSMQPAVPAGALVSAASGGASGGPPAFVDSIASRAVAASALASQLSCEGHVQRLQAVLLAAAPQRQRFWRSLLAAAGLGPLIGSS